MSLVGPSGCRKSQLVWKMLKNGTFQPPFEKICYFHQYHQPLFNQMRQEIPNIVKCVPNVRYSEMGLQSMLNMVDRFWQKDWQMFNNGTFQPPFEKIHFFYQYDQPLFNQMRQEMPNIEFVKCVDFELIENLPDRETLLIFDESCDEIMKSKGFEKLAIAGRHRQMSVIYIKHNL